MPPAPAPSRDCLQNSLVRMNSTKSNWTVAKVGGSLLDLSALRAILRAWLKAQPGPVLLVPGGGRHADRVRRFDQRHHLSPTACHRLAIRAMSRNARFLKGLMAPQVELVDSWVEAQNAGRERIVPILDPDRLLRADCSNAEALPHSWDVTSDSIAARVAILGHAPMLVLLKSVNLPLEQFPAPWHLHPVARVTERRKSPEGGNPSTTDWAEIARRGFVDAYFPTVLAAGLRVEWVNLRVWQRAPSRSAMTRASVPDRR